MKTKSNSRSLGSRVARRRSSVGPDIPSIPEEEEEDAEEENDEDEVEGGEEERTSENGTEGEAEKGEKTDKTDKTKNREKKEKKQEEEAKDFEMDVKEQKPFQPVEIPDGMPSIYHHLFSEARWHALQHKFQAELLQLYALPASSSLKTALAAGLMAMKTPFCTNDKSSDHHSSRCPICISPVLLALSQPLPPTNPSTSRLVCALSGAVMDEHNPPLVLPNGMVYSRKSLMDMAQARNGRVLCPRTNTEYLLTECRQAYIL